MRYGIVRDAESLPPPPDQKLILNAHGCEMLIEEYATGPATAKRMERLVAALKSGDELVLPGLDVFCLTTGEIALILQSLLSAGIAVTVATSPESATVLRNGDNGIQVVTLLAEHERRRPSHVVNDSRPRSVGGSRNPLSRYQVEYARKLYAKGTPLRSIGLLFQVSPDVIWKVIGAFAGPWACVLLNLPGL
jgi:hypothetical protein